MNIFTKSKAAPTKGEAIAVLRKALADATAAARFAHVDRRKITSILEAHADIGRQADAMMRSVL